MNGGTTSTHQASAGICSFGRQKRQLPPARGCSSTTRVSVRVVFFGVPQAIRTSAVSANAAPPASNAPRSNATALALMALLPVVSSFV